MSAYTDLTSLYDVIEISGVDATTFLQGQLTCDIEALDTQVIWGAHCSVKGRVVALFRLFKHHEKYVLITSCGLIDKLIKTLQRYVFRAKISMTQSSYQCYGLIQKTASDTTQEYYAVDDTGYSLTLTGGRTLVLKQHAPDQTQDNIFTWQQISIALNEPQLYQHTSELFLPNELGLDNLDGISLTKGCYIGQEIIARMHYLGKAKKGVRQITHQVEVTPGMPLYQAGKAIGHIITSTTTDFGYLSLASLKNDCMPPLYLDSAQQELACLHNA